MQKARKKVLYLAVIKGKEDRIISLQVEQLKNTESVIRQFTKEKYKRRLLAILDNYEYLSSFEQER